MEPSQPPVRPTTKDYIIVDYFANDQDEPSPSIQSITNQNLSKPSPPTKYIQKEEEEQQTHKINQKTIKNKECSIPEFFTKNRHFLIMTEGGKPVYSRYGDEVENCGVFATLSAMITKFTVFLSNAETKEQINIISNEKHLILFKKKSQLIFIAYTKKNDSISLLSTQLDYLYYQLMSILTMHFYEKIEANPSQCLTAMSDTEILFENMIIFSSKTFGPLLNSYCVMPIEGRSKIQTICEDNRGEALLCVVFTMYEVIAMSHMESIKVVASDVMLIQNLVLSSSSIRSTESWVPICLPGISEAGYLQLYCKFSKDNIGVCFVTECVDASLFMKFSEQFEIIRQGLIKEDLIRKIDNNEYNDNQEIEDEGNSEEKIIEKFYMILEEDMSDNNNTQKLLRSSRSITSKGIIAMENIIYGVCWNMKMDQFFLINFNYNFHKLNKEERKLMREYIGLYNKVIEYTKDETKEKEFMHIGKGTRFTNAVLLFENFVLIASFNFFMKIEEVGKHMKKSIKYIKSKDANYFILFK